MRLMMRLAGLLLIGLTLAVAAYARYAGDVVGEDGVTVRAGHAHYLVAVKDTARCQLGDQRIVVEPSVRREVLAGERIDPPVGGLLTCRGGEVMVTSGLALGLYPLADFALVPLLLGTGLIVFASFVHPPRHRPWGRPDGLR